MDARAGEMYCMEGQRAMNPERSLARAVMRCKRRNYARRILNTQVVSENSRLNLAAGSATTTARASVV